MCMSQSAFTMETSTQPVGTIAEDLVPKDTAPQMAAPTPPPAYTPRRLHGPSTYHHHHPSQALVEEATRVLSRQPLTTTLSGTAAMDELQEETEASGISLRINSSVTISNSNNLVCLRETPAEHANAIAQAVVRAMQESSSGQCGIPMIDEDGRPRPIRIEVDASMTVDGAGNIVGGEGIISEVLRQRSQLRRRERRWRKRGREEEEEQFQENNTNNNINDEDDQDEDGLSDRPVKRRRSS